MTDETRASFQWLMRLDASTNLRENRYAHRRRVQRERGLTRWMLGARVKGWLPVTVTIVRIGKGRLDGDNLQTAAKAVRDGVADALGVRDNHPQVLWVYEQLRGPEYRVRIEIERPQP
jgi:hypothetical protein